MKYFVVDTFADELFRGNPAGVCILDQWPDDALMQNIAFENNLAETAFVVKNASHYDLRWFTPETEMDLCGHATLASAFIISNFIDKGISDMSFSTKSGILVVTKKNELYEMDFPSRKPVKAPVNSIVQEAVNAKIAEAGVSRDLLLLVESEDDVRNIEINIALIKTVKEYFAFIITAPSASREYDFVSRFFAPNAGIMEDPVTGSAHCTLIPYWAEKLSKDTMVARQLSQRGGTLFCQNCGGRVKIAGKARLYMEGKILV